MPHILYLPVLKKWQITAFSNGNVRLWESDQYWSRQSPYCTTYRGDDQLTEQKYSPLPRQTVYIYIFSYAKCLRFYKLTNSSTQLNHETYIHMFHTIWYHIHPMICLTTPSWDQRGGFASLYTRENSSNICPLYHSALNYHSRIKSWLNSRQLARTKILHVLTEATRVALKVKPANFIIMAHSARGRWWWYGSRGGTLPAILHSI